MLIVHADNWAQIPKLTPHRSGTPDLERAIREAKRVIRAGGNNAEDTVRVYRRPTSPRFLRPAEALASVQRASDGKGFLVQRHASS